MGDDRQRLRGHVRDGPEREHWGVRLIPFLQKSTRGTTGSSLSSVRALAATQTANSHPVATSD